MTGGGRSRRAATGLVAALGLVFAATLVPAHGVHFDRAWCVMCGGYAAADFALNVVLFVPLGAALRRTFSTPSVRLWLLAAALSVGIELLQLAMPGRLTSVADVVANSAGAGVGLWLASRPWRRIVADRRLASRACAVAAAAVVLFTWLSVFALRPSLLPTTWFGQWTPELGHFETYEGRVLGVHVGERPVPGRRLEDGAGIRSDLLAGETLGVRFLAGPPPRDLAPVFSVFDDAQREMLLVGVDGTRLVVRLRRRAADLRLRQPELRMAMNASPGDTASVRVVLEPRYLAVSADGRRRRAVLSSPGRGWSLFLPIPPSPFADAAWLALLWLPVGFWWRPTATATVGAAMAVAALLIPAALPFASPTLAGLLGAIGGCLAGGLLAAVISRSGPGGS